MKKIILTALLIYLTVSAFSQTGIVRELNGNVELKHAGALAFIPAEAGSEVSQNSIISTGFRSTAIIAIGSTLITVQPLTRLTLAEISQSSNTENLNVNLQTGRIRVDVKPPAGTKANTTVQSPSATASVRGTSYEMDTKTLSVLDGMVNWKDNNGSASNIPGGFKGAIDTNGKQKNHIVLSIESTVISSPVGSGMSGETVGAPVVSIPAGELSIDLTW